VDVWHTDIISLSFGRETASPEIRDAINKALQHNVIFMAAASNAGNRGSVPFPATKANVFKIFATTPYGYASGFNVQVEDSNYSYFTLGESIRSTWPSQLVGRATAAQAIQYGENSASKTTANERDTWTIMSGTSFAAPIAAALVATIFQFYHANEACESRVRLRKESKSTFKSPEVVHAILDKMGRVTDNARYKFLPATPASQTHFYFRAVAPNKDGTTIPRNIMGQTAIEFFSYKLSEILDNVHI
jgi:subtilisin family serine protease